jgi:hypothetical protein
MSALSEEAYSAGWMSGLEYALWEALLGRRASYGRLVFTTEHRVRLRQLSESCSGWIVFDEHADETWLSVAEWVLRFSAWQTQDPSKRIDG